MLATMTVMKTMMMTVVVVMMVVAFAKDQACHRLSRKNAQKGAVDAESGHESTLTVSNALTHLLCLPSLKRDKNKCVYWINRTVLTLS